MTATTLKNNQFQIILTALVIVLIAIAFLPGALDTLAQSATCQDKVSDPDAGFLYIRCRGATIFYGEGTCEGNCAGKPNLPIDAKEALDALDVLVPASFVYFRLVDSEKNPTNG
ncbi:MAG: hypothetical protein IIC79_00650 [Chloroflexi bacterium]|nr:hypothetical protein [Chloroflexota bacterium]